MNLLVEKIHKNKAKQGFIELQISISNILYLALTFKRIEIYL